MAKPARRRLARDLSLRMAVAVVVGNVIGSGIFLKPGGIAADGGSFGLIIGIWVLGGALCVLGALCFAELAAMFPRAGGLYVYLREAYGRPVAFLFGWTEFLVRVPGSANADLSDAALAEVLNWLLPRISAAEIPADFHPYSAAEVAEWRTEPLTDVSGMRRTLLSRMAELGIHE